MPVLYPCTRSYCCGGWRHIPCPFFLLFVTLLVSEVPHIIKNQTLSSGSNLGPTERWCRALGSPCTLLSRWHTGGREANVMLRAIIHRFWKSPIYPGHSQLRDTYRRRDNHPMSTLSIWVEQKVPCSYLCIWNAPGFRKRWMAVSVTALVLSGFHPHQSVVLYICSVPVLPPELAWERKWKAEWMCSLDWDSKRPFPSTHTPLSVTSEYQYWQSQTSNVIAGFLEATEMTAALNMSFQTPFQETVASTSSSLTASLKYKGSLSNQNF